MIKNKNFLNSLNLPLFIVYQHYNGETSFNFFRSFCNYLIKYISFLKRSTLPITPWTLMFIQIINTYKSYPSVVAERSESATFQIQEGIHHA